MSSWTLHGLQDRTEWVIVSTGMFTSFLFEPSFGVVDGAKYRARALGRDTAVTVTRDIGTLTAEIIFAEPPVINRVVYTAGDITVTYARLDIVDSVLSRKAGGNGVLGRNELAKDPDDPIKNTGWCSQGKGVSWQGSARKE